MYWNLINEFKKLTGVPIILNTSFNDKDEPIVQSPEDAIADFVKMDLDALVLDNILLLKER